MRLARLAIGALAVGLSAGPAWAQDDVSVDEDDFSRPSSSSSANSLRGQSKRLDSVDSGAAEELDTLDTGQASGLDAVDTGRTATTEHVDRRWQPPPCDGTLPEGVRAPEGAGEDGWSAALGDAQGRLAKSQQKWRDVETGAVVPKYDTPDPQLRRVQRDKLIQDSRDEYGQARCALLGLIEHARRAGVPPGVLRPYRSELPADLQE